MSEESPPPQLSPDGRSYWGVPRGVLWLLVLLMVIAIVLAAGSHNTITGQPNPQLIMDESGNGNSKTPSFTTSGGWEIDWSYDCSNLGHSATFQVTVYESASKSQVDIAAIALGTKGAGVAFEDQGGTYYLQVISECNWHIMVK